ncbi:MAG TPA: ABC transporter substrate-binding protein, partial [Bacillota bacterium]|nr:ABC transporter substrate-binding protein [Bacillota bacterium]
MLLAACSNTPENEAGEEAARAEKSQHSAETEENSAFPVTVTDAIGEEVTFEKAPERIVSLIPSNTEIAYALRLGEQIVGVSDYDNYPEEVLEKEKVGGLELNVEAILGLEPDLV